MACPICDGEFEKNLIFKNDKIMVFTAINPIIPGHLQIFPKEHISILEEVPNELLDYMSSVSNKLSMLLFELLKVHGTNMIIQNGVPAGQTIPHFSINIIPRRSDDGLKLEWDMKQTTPESLESMQRIISEGVAQPPEKRIEIEEAPVETISKNLPEKMPVKEEATEETDEEEEPPAEKKINYYLRSLERIP